MYLIGIDVGGTNSKFGLIKDSEIIKSCTIATNTFDVIRQLVNGAKELVQSTGISWEEIKGVAVGFPGMVIDDILKDSPNIGLQNCNLQEILAQELDKPVVVRNDADMAALAEHKLGAGYNCDNMVMITIGTGVGGGIIINKELFTGNGGAGELGHIVINKDGLKCKCGRNGCAEQYVSLVALDRIAREIIAEYPETSIRLPEDRIVEANEIVKAYKRNDACAIAILTKYTTDLSSFLLNICNMFRPERIVIGGGLSYAPDIIQMVARMCKEQNFGYKESPSVEIVASTLGNEAGIMGAVACFESVQETIELTQFVDDGIRLNLESLSNLDALRTENTDSGVLVENEGTSYIQDGSFDILEAAYQNSEITTTDVDASENSYEGVNLDKLNEMLRKKD